MTAVAPIPASHHPAMPAKLFRLLAVAAWVIIGLAVIHLTAFDGWQDLTIGRFHRRAHEMFTHVEGVTEARIYRLMGTKAQPTSETFPIRPYDTSVPVCGSVTLTGAPLAAFLDHWRVQSPSQWRQGLCHDPAYGFRLYRGGRLIAETSICWQCNNFYIEAWPFGSGWYGLDTGLDSSQKLLTFCDGLLPYHRSEKKPSKP